MMRKYTTQRGNEAAADFSDFTTKPKPSEDPLHQQTSIQHIKHQDE